MTSEHWTTIVVAVIGTIGVLIAAYWQFVYRPTKQAVDSVKETSKVATQEVSKMAETTVNKIAENTLTILERLLADERLKVQKLEEKLQKAEEEKSGLYSERNALKIEIQRHLAKIEDLEHELERLRGRMDGLLRSNSAELKKITKRLDDTNNSN